MKSHKTRFISIGRLVGLSLLTFFVLVFFVLAFLVLFRFRESFLFRAKYGDLEIGMTKQAVSGIWGRPEFVIELEGGKEIWSYKNGGHPIHLVRMSPFKNREARRKTKGVVLDELDDMTSYSNAEMLFDVNGELEAYTIIGDTLVVHSRYGDIPGPRWDVYGEFLGNLPKQGSESEETSGQSPQ